MAARPRPRRRRPPPDDSDDEAGDAAGAGAPSAKPLDDHKLVRNYFRQLLKEWERDLDLRPDAEKATPQGRTNTKTQKQCKDYIRPLFKLCKKKDVPPSILDKARARARRQRGGALSLSLSLSLSLPRRLDGNARGVPPSRARSRDHPLPADSWSR